MVANRIGTNAAGTVAHRQRRHGIRITRRSDDNEIGGTEYIDSATGQANNPTGSKGTVTAGLRGAAAGQPDLGQRAQRRADRLARARRNMLNGNFIGTTADGDAAIGNAGDGVWINARTAIR